MLRRIARRTIGIAFGILGALAVVVCAVSIYQWVRGYWVADVWEASAGHAGITVSATRSVRVTSGRGVVIVMYSHQRSSHPPVTRTWNRVRSASRRWTYEEEGPEVPRQESRHRRFDHNTMDPGQLNLQNRTLWQKLGFNAWSGRSNASYLGIGPMRVDSWTGRAPYWAIVLASGAVASLWLRTAGRRLLNVRRRRRAGRGLCGRCGYDVRASPERCPECGEVVGTNAER
jgi:hypothetical protein